MSKLCFRESTRPPYTRESIDKTIASARPAFSLTQRRSRSGEPWKLDPDKYCSGGVRIVYPASSAVLTVYARSTGRLSWGTYKIVRAIAVGPTLMSMDKTAAPTAFCQPFKSTTSYQI